MNEARENQGKPTTLKFRVRGMFCGHCEETVSKAAGEIPGVLAAKASLAESSLTVECGPGVSQGQIARAVKAAGYEILADTASVGKVRDYTPLYFLLIFVSLYLLASRLGWLDIFQKFPVVGEGSVSFALLFSIGFFTSFHCVGMCGGLYLSVNAAGDAQSPVRRAILYHSGRILGYAFVGGILGALGNAVSITMGVRAAIGIGAGLWMLLAGVNLSGNLGLLRRVQLRLPKGLAARLRGMSRHSPFMLGLANALMPCGPLQSMQLFAIASGGFFAGAFAMFAFALGTSPLLLAFASGAGFLRMGFREKMLKASGALLLLLGLFTLQNSFALLGVTTPTAASADTAAVRSEMRDGVQVLYTQVHPGSFENVEIRAGVPLRWTIHAHKDSLNGCNNKVVLPRFNREISLHEGDNVLEFTPRERGDFSYTCWMGMLKSRISVR